MTGRGGQGKPAKVLIIGINYRPELTAVGPYTAGIAEVLARRGDQVTVLTGLPHNPVNQLSAAERTRDHSWRRPRGRSHWPAIPTRSSALSRSRPNMDRNRCKTPAARHAIGGPPETG